MKIYKFCICHEAPYHQLEEDVTIIWLGDADVPVDYTSRAIIVKKLFPDLDFYRPYLLGAAGILAAKRILELVANPNDEDVVQISLYRKIVSSDAVGNPSQSYPGMRLLEKGAPVDPRQLLPSQGQYLLTRPRLLTSYLHQYGMCHRAQDLLRYTAIAMDLGIIENTNALTEFFGLQIFIPGGLFGCLPAKQFMEIAEKIENVSLTYCLMHRPTDIDLYQRRAVAFCNERLESYLLLRTLTLKYGDRIPDFIWGYMVTFINKEDSDYRANAH